MVKEELFYDSRDGKNKIRALRWIPDGEVKGIFQIIHGMAEHIERYDDFARFMADNGYIVVANDHLGHGKSCSDKSKKGYFCENDPVTVVTRDVHRIKKMTQEKYPGKPYIILGHSMGSLILRNYLFRYGKGIDGAIIMGTASQPGYMTVPGKLLIRLIALFKGWEYRSKLADGLVNGKPNARIKNKRTDFDWLTRVDETVDKYIADDDCGFLFTLNGHYTVVESVDRLNSKKELTKMPKDLPVLFVSGEEDPVGGYGAGVKRAYEQFEQAGMTKLSIKLYPGARHELLNETNREEVYKDLLEFCDEIH